ncbi:MAG: sugar transferase [Pseudomonadota bacterium]
MTVHFNDLTDTAGSTVVAEYQRSVSSGLYTNFLKRLLDICFVLLVAPFAAIVIAAFALIIALDGHNPFYRQDRVGKDGRVFSMWKLRSMVANADDILAAYLTLNPNAKAEWDRSQKLRVDPRITRIGSFIRKSSIDELPQLFNVLVGDMSVVGPRPMMVSQQIIYPGTLYYKMRPGITGFWQVSDRNECEFPARAKYDDKYYREQSLATDVRVLGQTAVAVLRCTGY